MAARGRVASGLLLTNSHPTQFLCSSPAFLWEALRHLSAELSSVTQSRLTLCDATDYSTPGFPVHHQLPELAQIHVIFMLQSCLCYSQLSVTCYKLMSSLCFSLANKQRSGSQGGEGSGWGTFTGPELIKWVAGGRGSAGELGWPLGRGRWMWPTKEGTP